MLYIINNNLISERMVKTVEEFQDEELKIKEEKGSIREEVITSCTVEDTRTVYVKEEVMKEEEIKEENVCIKEEVLSSSTEEDTCTVYIKKEDVKMENTEITGNNKISLLLSYLFT